MIRSDENPPTRHPLRPLSEAQGRWWIAKVKPRMEKACAWDFYHSDIEYYLPLYTKISRRPDNNKPRKSVLPLFPGYICFAMDQPYNVYSHGRLVSLVEVKNQARLVKELSQIQSALESGISIAPQNQLIEIGEMVDIIHGPLRGLQGRVTRTLGAQRLVLEVEGLGMASVGLENDWVSVSPSDKSSPCHNILP